MWLLHSIHAAYSKRNGVLKYKQLLMKMRVSLKTTVILVRELRVSSLHFYTCGVFAHLAAWEAHHITSNKRCAAPRFLQGVSIMHHISLCSVGASRADCDRCKVCV